MNNERLNTMRNRIENVGLEDAGVDEGLVAEIIDELIDSRSQVTTLTAERDEARKELEDAQRQEIETIAAVINHRKLIDEQKQKIDTLTAELAALKSCPAMGEVDALVKEIDPSIDLDALDLNPSPVRRLANLARKLGGHINGRDFSIKNIAEKFCSDEIRVPDPTVWCHLWAIERKFEELIISRRSIASREEVVGLLKWLKNFVNNDRFIDEVSEGTPQAVRIAEILDPGKRCQKCHEKLEGHEDESGTHCRWCVTCGDPVDEQSVANEGK